MKKLLIAGLISFASLAAQAEGWHAGLQYSLLDAELADSGFTTDSEPSAVNFSVGKKIHENFAVEGLLGFGLSDDEVEDSGFDFELKTVIGISAVGILPLTENFSLYGKLGVAQIEYNDSDGDSSDGSGALFGAGLMFDVNEQFGLNLEYVRYPDAEYDDFDIDIEASTLNFGVYMKF